MEVLLGTMFSVGPRRQVRYETIEELWEAVFSVWSVPSLYYEDQRETTMQQT
jgi:hypothetical protein